ncbi:unnamed protein product, partial [Musa hybrid cultivar]
MHAAATSEESQSLSENTMQCPNSSLCRALHLAYRIKFYWGFCSMAAGGGSIWAEEDCEGKSMPASILSLHYCGRTPGEEAAILHFSFHLWRIISVKWGEHFDSVALGNGCASSYSN